MTGIVSSVDMGLCSVLCDPYIQTNKKGLVFQKISVWRNSGKARSGLSLQTLRADAVNDSVRLAYYMRSYDPKTTI